MPVPQVHDLEELNARLAEMCRDDMKRRLRGKSGTKAELFVEDKEFQRYVFDQYVNRMEKMASLIEEVRFTSLDKRLEQWLETYPEKHISITHEEIGDILGTSREVISRLLKGFEKEGLVKLSRKKIQILN